MLKRVIFCFVSLLVSVSVLSETLDEAKEMYNAGDYSGALPVFREYLDKKPKDASLNHWYGVCLMQTGQMQQAKSYLEFAHKRKVVQSPRYLAEIAFYEYDVDAADGYIDAYRQAMKKAKKTVSEDVEILSERINRMRAMLDRVERIVIIDSVAVNADVFFEAYRLTVESGSLNSPEILPKGIDAAMPTVVYMPESRGYMMWAAPDDEQNYRLVASSLLLDGSWEHPRPVGDNLREGGDANYPFLLSDGVTLYFANTGENSLGGYDIFMSRRDGNEFLQPQNIGMPYNSPYDDYMLAIDETTGVGWWATDRNRLDGMVTIYKFIPREMRTNYAIDTPQLNSLARIDSYADTWPEGADYADVLSAIEEIDFEQKVEKKDFEFSLPGNRVYSRWSDFKSDDAREAMAGYLDAVKRHDADKIYLEELRRRYAAGDYDCADEIKALERSVRKGYIELRRLSNEVIRYERNVAP